MSLTKIQLLAWSCLAWGSLVLGIVGAFLPILPTTPFLILAAFGFARSNKRIHNWLVNHPQFGPPIADWERHRAISKKAKITALVTMAVLFSVSIFIGLRWELLAIQAVCLGGAALFIVTRKNPPNL